jgi:signal-transduction protein with cAMP-binding, CBS, and nucleotidyltransferase domain
MHSLAAIFRRRAGEEAVAPLARVPAGATVGDAVAAMAAARASAALVIDEGGRTLGIVTEQDVVRRIAFKLPPETAVTTVMTAPVETIRADDYVFHAIARMRRRRLRHMPMVGADGSVLGVLDLHRAYAAAIAGMVDLVDQLTHEETLEGLKSVKRAQVALADALFDEFLPAPEIQALLTDVNRDIYARIAQLLLAAMRDEGWGGPPVRFCIMVMGSGGRGENYLYPDQDNGFILDDYPDEAHGSVDAWFIEFAERMTRALDAVGIPFCTGFVMATNPLWRKTRAQWKEQMKVWFRQRLGASARFADIFFDFVPAWGEAAYARELREYVTPLIAENRPFLRDIEDLQKDYYTGLGWFGRIRTDAARRGEINLKHRGTLPLVDAVRILALLHRVPATATLARIDGLAAAGVLNRDEQDELHGAFRHVTRLLLGQQLADFKAGRTVGNHVPLRAMSRMERGRLVDSFRAIERIREKVAVEIGGRTV